MLPGLIKSAAAAHQAKGGPAFAARLRRAGGGAAPLSGMMSDYLVPSVQARWLGASVSWYTPQMVEYIYRMALSGDLQMQWEMFDMMESTWPELSKCENELKDSVCDLLGHDPGRPHLEICPFGGEDATDEAKRRAEVVDMALRSMNPRPASDENGLHGTLRDIMDARFKGIAVLEVDWEPRSLSRTGVDSVTAMCPRATRWVHPSWYGYPFGPGNERLLLKLGGLRPDNQFTPMIKPLPMGGNLPPIQSPMNFYGAGDFAEFPDNKFIVAVSKSKSGHPLGGAMLHILAWPWAAMNFSMDWFLNFAQLFGQPIRWANYSPDMDEVDEAKLELMLQNMGTSAWGMFPEGVSMELKESVSRAQDNPQLALIEFANKAARNLILRQTLTSDVGEKGSGSMALGKVHDRVLDDVKLGCGRWVCLTLNQLIRYIAVLNFGNAELLPEAKVIVPDEDESVSTSTSLANLSTAGLEPDDEALPVVSEKMGYKVRRKAVEAEPGAGPGGSLRAKRQPMSNPELNDNEAFHRAFEEFHAQQTRQRRMTQSPVEPFIDKMSPALAEAFRGSRAPVLAILQASDSAEEFERKLAAHYRDWKPERIAGIVEEAMQLAAAKGAAGAVHEK